MAGYSDALSGKSVPKQAINNVVNSLSHTNTILISVIKNAARPVITKFADTINMDLYNIVKNVSCCSY